MLINTPYTSFFVEKLDIHPGTLLKKKKNQCQGTSKPTSWEISSGRPPNHPKTPLSFLPSQLTRRQQHYKYDGQEIEKTERQRLERQYRPQYSRKKSTLYSPERPLQKLHCEDHFQQYTSQRGGRLELPSRQLSRITGQYRCPERYRNDLIPYRFKYRQYRERSGCTGRNIGFRPENGYRPETEMQISL